MRSIPLSLALLASVLFAGATAAQTVQGSFVDPASGEPIAGARAVLRNSDGREAAAAMTRVDGTFALRAPGAGRYVLQVERIGYALTRSDPIELGAGETVQRRVAANAQRIALAGIVVQGRARCTPRPGSGPETATVWEEARKALGSARESNEHAYRYSVRRFWRKLDPAGSILQDSVSPSDISTGSPFVAVPLEKLATVGYIEADSAELLFHAPDARVLLSEDFQESHCFALKEAPQGEPGLIGLSFEPVRQGDLSDVRGTLWVERATSELKRLEYQYTKVPGLRGTSASAAGRMEFRRLDDGRWVVSRWNIRMPTVTAEQVQPTAHIPGAPGTVETQLRYKLTGLREEGGDVLTVVTASGSRVSLTGSSVLRGLVFDSTQSRPLAGARVSVGGPGHSAMTDSAGRFEIRDIPPGDYQVTFASPRVQALGWRPRGTSVSLREGATLEQTLAVPSLATVWASGCDDADRTSGTGVLVGAVRGAAGEPQAGARVTVAWGGGTAERLQVLTDSAGVYRACAAPAGAPLTVTAATQTAVLTLSQVRLASGATLQQDVSLPAASTVAARPAAPGGAAGGLSGVVRGADGRPVAGATVRFGALAAVTTDAQGRFRLRAVAPGDYEVTVAHASLGTRAVRMAVPAGVGDVELRAAGGAGSLAASVQRVVQLAGIAAQGRRAGLDIAGFYERQHRGIGHFLTERELARPGSKLSSVMRTIPGVRVVRYSPKQGGRADGGSRSGTDIDEQYRIASTRGYSTGVDSNGGSSLQFCYMDVYLDGNQVAFSDPERSQNIDAFALTDLDGVEIYAGPAETPPEYRGRWTGCGVVLMWSKR